MIRGKRCEMGLGSAAMVSLSAVATAAGYSIAHPRIDRGGIDLEILAGGGMRPRLEIQNKATINLRLDDDGVCRFPRKVRNYNLLRESTLGLSRKMWRAPTEEPGGVLWETGTG